MTTPETRTFNCWACGTGNIDRPVHPRSQAAVCRHCGAFAIATDHGARAPTITELRILATEPEMMALQDEARVIEAEPDAADDEPDDRCTHPGGHVFECTGTAYGGDDPRWHGEGRCLCIHCGADGDA